MNPPPELVPNGARDRGLFWMVAVSAAVHVVVMLALLFGPAERPEPWVPPPAYTVDLVTGAELAGNDAPLPGEPGKPPVDARAAEPPPAPEPADETEPEPPAEPEPEPPAPVEPAKPLEPAIAEDDGLEVVEPATPTATHSAPPATATFPPATSTVPAAAPTLAPTVAATKTVVPSRTAAATSTAKPRQKTATAKPAATAVKAKTTPTAASKKAATPSARPTTPGKKAPAATRVPTAAVAAIPTSRPATAAKSEPNKSETRATPGSGAVADEAIQEAIQKRLEQLRTGNGGSPDGVPGSSGGPASAGPGSGTAGTVQGLQYLLYYNDMINRIRQSWHWVGASTSLSAEVAFAITATGAIENIQTTTASGDPTFDASVERAVRGASPLPPPPEQYRKEFSSVLITFRPEDLRQ